ncbi:MAG TPA: TorF family putative porin [Ramlibacter sp.]|uniref:TorF family putative porin n=1 Tax=Ramlibacter sp. TaxID=1917967 RepID=UPI002D7F8146|nr:TorF family putative porin [Ramlibacter sp.]HET8748925.1 TorF family putative porin [Ramlibacter sp.]
MKAKLAVLLSTLAASSALMAQTSTAAPEPDSTLSFNVGAVTDYRYRGISQSRLRPALQGGADFAHKSGFYVGTWGSTIKWLKDAGGDANVEVDVYGGYRTTLGGVGLDVGVLRYLYPGSDIAPATGLVNPDTTEVYLAGSLGPATLKYSHATTNLFGTPDSKGSGYLDLSANFELPWYGLTLTPHVGHQRVRHNSSASYTDWSLALGKDFGNGFSASLAYVDTNITVRAPNGKDLGRAGLVAGVKYAF